MIPEVRACSRLSGRYRPNGRIETTPEPWVGATPLISSFACSRFLAGLAAEVAQRSNSALLRCCAQLIACHSRGRSRGDLT
jgi:hypothetical protein